MTKRPTLCQMSREDHRRLIPHLMFGDDEG